MATALFTRFERLFTFLEEDGGESANKISEQMPRMAVQWREICFGNRSRGGDWLLHVYLPPSADMPASAAPCTALPHQCGAIPPPPGSGAFSAPVGRPTT